MGLAEKVLQPAAESRTLQVKPWGDAGWSGFSGTGTHAGVTVNSTSALQLLTVYGCVSLIADTIATLPIDVFRADSSEEAPKPPWLRQPNPYTDIIELTTQILTSLLLDGNAYVLVLQDRSFMTSELFVLDPTMVEVRATDGGSPSYWVQGARIPNERLRHVKGITRPGSLKGLSPVEACRQGVGLGLAAQEFGARFFGQGQHMSGVIETAAEYNQDTAHEIKAGWVRDHSGLARAWEPGILWGGAQWKPISVTPEQAQFLDTRKFSSAEIAAQMFLLDPTLLGIPVDGKSLTYANLEQRGIHLVQFSLLRWIVRLENLYTGLLPRGQREKFNVAGLQRADLKTRYEAYSIGLAGQPFLVPNEPRSLEDLEPLPGGDEVAPPVVPAQEDSE